MVMLESYVTRGPIPIRRKDGAAQDWRHSFRSMQQGQEPAHSGLTPIHPGLRRVLRVTVNLGFRPFTEVGPTCRSSAGM